MIEPVSGSRCLRRHITAVVGIDRRLERHPAGNFNAGLCETVELGRIVVEQHDPRAFQHPERAAVMRLSASSITAKSLCERIYYRTKQYTFLAGA